MTVRYWVMEDKYAIIVTELLNTGHTPKYDIPLEYFSLYLQTFLN